MSGLVETSHFRGIVGAWCWPLPPNEQLLTGR